MYQFLQNQRGTAAIEYSLFISFLGLVSAGALHVLGSNLVDAFSLVSERLTTIQVIEEYQYTGLEK